MTSIPDPDTPSRSPFAPPLRPFLVLWGGQAVSLLGSQAVQFALIWWITETTRSATLLSAAALAGLAPQILLGPLLGTLVDRWDRKRVMLLADGAAAAAAAGLAVAFASGRAEAWHVLLLLLVRSLAAGLQTPALQATTTLMVPERWLTRIQGLNQALAGGSAIVAAPLGALLAATLPMEAVMGFDVATALVAVVALALVAVPPPERSAARAAGLLDELAAGARYLARRRGHLALVAVASVVNLWLVPAFALLPLFVSEALAGDVALLGGMSSLFGVGSLAGGVALSAWGGFPRRIVTSIVGLVALGAAVLALGAVPAGSPSAALVAMAAVGLAVPFVNGPILAIFQATIEPAFQGRVFSWMGSVAGLTAPLGLVLAAPVAEALGTRTWLVGGGTACLVVAAVMALAPAIAGIERRPT